MKAAERLPVGTHRGGASAGYSALLVQRKLRSGCDDLAVSDG